MEDALNGTGDEPIDRSKYDVVTAEDNASDDEYNDFKGFDNQKEDDEEEEEQMMSLSDLPQEKKSEGEEQEKEEENLAADTNVSDLDWLKSRSTRIKENGEVPENEKEESQDVEKEEDANYEETEPELTPEEKTVQKSKKLEDYLLETFLMTPQKRISKTYFWGMDHLKKSTLLLIQERVNQKVLFMHNL